MAAADGGAPLDALARAAADWDRLEGRLTPDGRDRLAACLTEFRAAGPGTARRTAAAASALRLLGGEAGPEGSRLAGAPPAPPGFTAEDLAVLVLDGHRMVGPVLGAVRDRLLAAPAVPATGPADPYDARLIRLRGAGGLVTLPAFQFRSPPDAWPSVLTVNEVLDAARDPWGAADWWLSPNAWLGTAPASLLGGDRDGELPAVAGHVLT
ncbi:hypothetical protein ABT185_17535 [Streptomyces clavifer]|uniref:hypothetical protein n=1 Tax=Streptomyces clavifer TaxID=68188 RepID=UPI00332748E2